MPGHDFGYQAAQHARFQARIADPGDAGDIVLEPDKSVAYVPIETAAAETRTLKDPDHAGLRLTIFMDTDGGDCTITADTAFNEAGNNTITLDDKGETIVLESISIEGSAVWRVIGTDGASVSTV